MADGQGMSHLLIDLAGMGRKRWIDPSWTISELRNKIYNWVGVRTWCQDLFFNAEGDEHPVPIKVANVEDEDTTRLAEFQLEPGRYTHLIEKENEEEKEKEKVEDKDNLEADSSPEDNTGAVSSPKDTTGPEKYDLPQKAYEEMSNTFLAFKKAKELGRFDPKAPGKAKARVAAHAREAADRGIEPGRRCHIEDPKVLLYGVVRYVGDVPEIPDPGFWVGVQLDEPLGRNDGSIGGKRYWGEAGSLNYGMFVRPARIEIGDFRPLNDLEGDPDREEM
ncbi:hypothetical protein RB598_009038 [Gaeumannomyces tritici]